MLVRRRKRVEETLLPAFSRWGQAQWPNALHLPDARTGQVASGFLNIRAWRIGRCSQPDDRRVRQVGEARNIEAVLSVGQTGALGST